MDGGPINWKDRIEYGRKYIWHPELGFWYAKLEKGENPVHIFPPWENRPAWYVVVPRTERFHDLLGPDAERRAFAIVDGYIKQNQDC